MRYAQRYAESKRGAKKTRAFDVKLHMSRAAFRFAPRGMAHVLGASGAHAIAAAETARKAPLPNRAQGIDRARSSIDAER
jgi:hypothetical protein